MSLTWLDLTVIAVPFALVMLVALRMRRYLRSVADYLAANRCAGRYLICTSAGETGAGVMVMMVSLEVFSRTGFSLSFWSSFALLVTFFFGIVGLVSYRFRETRSLTFHQFFEVRYSKRVRVLASFLNVFSGIINFGIQPAVGARFFVFFCGLPVESHLLGMTIPTFIPIMLVLMGLSVYLALSGGQISVMVTDALEGMISALFYLIIAVFVLASVSVAQMRTALLSGEAGKSYVDPFDISGQSDFNGWFVVFSLLLNLYYYRGGAWSQGFAAAAKSAHEGRMAQILGNWRNHSYLAMTALISMGAFTLLHHPDFAHLRNLVDIGVQRVDGQQLQNQMRMPMALGLLLSSGVKGAFCAVALFGILASQGSQLHSYGSTVLQDVVLPLRKKAFTPEQHLWWLKAAAIGVAVFACCFSIIYKPVDYLRMIVTLVGVIYLGGVGVVVWGGLYWRRGTRQGAMAALVVGSSLALSFTLMQQFWTSLTPAILRLAPSGAVHNYVLQHAEKFPFNGIELSMLSAGAALASYILVSLWTCREPFNLDAMLHRGQYRVDAEAVPVPVAGKRSLLHRLINVDEHFTRGDKVLAIGTLIWTLAWKALALGILVWALLVGKPSASWWFDYTMITQVWLTLPIGVVVTVWFAVGLTKDLRMLFRTLRDAERDAADDGTVSSTPQLEESVR